MNNINQQMSIKLLVCVSAILFGTLYCADSDPSGPSGTGNAYYVSVNGSDSGEGTLSDPWKTVSHAAATLSAGDSVLIMSGTYNERVIPAGSGTSGDPITYTAYQNGTVIIDGTGIDITPWGGLFDISGRNWIVLDGLSIRNSGTGNNANGILIDSCSNITIKACSTYNTVSSGVSAWNSSEILIENCDVQLACNDGEQECITIATTSNFIVRNSSVSNGGPGSNGGEGIDAKDGSHDGAIYGNTVSGVNRLGIYIDAWDKNTHSIDIYGNRVFDTASDGFVIVSEAGGLLHDINIYNNLAFGNNGSGIVVAAWGEPGSSHPVQDIFITNNTFYGNGSGIWGCGISVENSEANNIEIRNNICSGNVIQISTEAFGTGLTIEYNLIDGNTIEYGSNYVEGNPDFLSASGGDFHLTSDSPAIDAGTSTNAPTDDFEGISRPQGSGYDIGAYEYH